MVNSIYKGTKNFIERKVSTKQPINILEKKTSQLVRRSCNHIGILLPDCKLYGNPTGAESDAYPKAKIESPNIF